MMVFFPKSTDFTYYPLVLISRHAQSYPGLSLSFISPVALIFAPIANLVIIVWKSFLLSGYDIKFCPSNPFSSFKYCRAAIKVQGILLAAASLNLCYSETKPLVGLSSLPLENNLYYSCFLLSNLLETLVITMHCVVVIMYM